MTVTQQEEAITSGRCADANVQDEHVVRSQVLSRDEQGAQRPECQE
ncbi:hypothetical protein KCP76_04650 [Salmonella enterica subsp. enterica serovar Weltevreden]|nr:hypothetical protein KCP76_04650 [Salmonella enterica subsp. enterica serovar Weltevreden]